MSAGEAAPCLGVIEATWERIENQSQAASNSGDEDILEFGDAFWVLDVSVTIRNRAHFDEWDSFLARRRGQDLTFTMYRSMRPRPRDTLITSDTGLILNSIDAGLSQITLSGYGAGRQAHYGDMISYRTAANGYWVGQVDAPATANGSGVITVPVWPRPRAAHASVPDPRRFEAPGEFRLSDKPRIREGFKNWSVRFEAQQVIR